MNVIIALILCLTASVVSFFIGKSYSKVIKPTEEDLYKYIHNIGFKNTLNPLVKDIYLQFIDKEKIKYFQETNCNIRVSNLDIEFWSENSVAARIFTKLPESVLKTYNMTAKEINDTLTLADKTILDKIAEAIKVNNKEFISRLFI